MKLLQKNLFLMIVLIFLAGCKHKKAPEIIKNESKNILKESVARIVDIPDVPLGFEVKEVVQDIDYKSCVQIIYQAKNNNFCTMQDFEKSYNCDMELLGWNYNSSFRSDKEMVMIFERPRGKRCVVSLHNSGLLVVTITNKKEDL